MSHFKLANAGKEGATNINISSAMVLERIVRQRYQSVSKHGYLLFNLHTSICRYRNEQIDYSRFLSLHLLL